MNFVFIYLSDKTILVMPKKIFLALLFAFGAQSVSFAQFGFSHEVGAFVGPTLFYSDYGQSDNTETNLTNNGFGIGLVHYMNFSYRAECNCYTPETYFNDHFKLRTEFSYTRAKLNHAGEWVKPERTSYTAKQLRAMQGLASVTDIGMQLEYFPWSIRQFTATDGAFGPFVALGAHYNFFSPKNTSELGEINTSISYPEKYLYNDAVTNASGSTWSVVASAGSRYKLTELSDLFVELRWQYYFSNWVEGVSPDPIRYPENKANDWNLWLNFGYIYYLD